MSKFLIYYVDEDAWWRKNPLAPGNIYATEITEATHYDNTSKSDMGIMDNAVRYSEKCHRIIPFTNYEQNKKQAKKYRIEYIKKILDDFKAKNIRKLQRELAELEPILERLNKFDILEV